MRRAFAIAFAAVLCAATVVASEDWRGNNRLAGSVLSMGAAEPSDPSQFSRLSKTAVKTWHHGRFANAVLLASS